MINAANVLLKTIAISYIFRIGQIEKINSHLSNKMSTLFDALGWHDIISKNNLKPWWETILSFSVALMTITAFVLSYLSDTEFLRCIPENEMQVSNFSITLAAFVNKACFREVDYLLRNGQWLSVLAAGLIFIANNFWLYIPKVGEAIFNFVDVCDLYQEFKTPLKEAFRCWHKLRLKNEAFMDNIIKDGDQKNLDRAKTLIIAISYGKCMAEEYVKSLKLLDRESEIHPGTCSTFRKCYLGRNLTSLLANISVLACIIALGVTGIWVNPERFPCKSEKHISGTYKCLYTTFDFMYPAWVAFMLSTLTQIVIQSFLLCKYHNFTDLQLILKFAQHSSEKEPLNDFQTFVSDLNETKNEHFVKALLEHELVSRTGPSEKRDLVGIGMSARKSSSADLLTKKSSTAYTESSHITIAGDDACSSHADSNTFEQYISVDVDNDSKHLDKKENDKKSIDSEGSCTGSSVAVNLSNASSPGTPKKRHADKNIRNQNISSQKDHLQGHDNSAFSNDSEQESNMTKSYFETKDFSPKPSGENTKQPRRSRSFKSGPTRNIFCHNRSRTFPSLTCRSNGHSSPL